MMTNDVEKRWHDPEMFRAAVTYVVSVIVVAAVAFASFALIADHSVISAILVPTILFVGGIGGFIRTYQVWRAGGTWPIWHGAGWFLLSFSLVCLAIPGYALSG